MLVEIRKADGPVGFTGNLYVADYAKAHFLAAYIDENPVGQICHVFDGFQWWVDSLVVRPDLRKAGIALKLIEANYHYALQNEIVVLLSRANKHHGVEPQTFLRNDSRMSLGRSHELSVDSRHAFFIRRDLSELKAKIESGEVEAITFPYRVELQQQAQSA